MSGAEWWAYLKRRGGVLTYDEARALEGIPPEESHDE